MAIDVHAHYFPEAYLDHLSAHGDRTVDGARGLGGGDRPGEVAARLGLMDEAGVDRQVLSVSSLGPYFDDVTHAVVAARLANDLFGDVVQDRPDRFSAFAVVPLPHIDAALDELDRALARPGMVGLTVSSAVLGRSIADPLFEPLFEELNRRGTTLFIHPAGRGAESSLITGSGLTWLVGAAIEDTIVVAHLLARGIPTRFPNVRIVNAHLGGSLAVLLGRLDEQFPRAVPGAPEPPSLAARRMWFDTVSHADKVALDAATASFGADRLVLGTDFPYVRGPGYGRAVAHIREGRPEHEAGAILELTAARALGLGPSHGPTGRPGSS